jgi:predicted nuclease of predicted toxin-antitoxin system
MRFLADMGISLRTVSWLREQGHDVVHLRDQGLQKLPDEEIVIKAQQEERIILTVDLDFAQILAITRFSLPSVVLFRLGNENYDRINDCLTFLMENCVEDLMLGLMVLVNSKNLRIRKLPME